jgi:hypothetical protein
MKNKLYILIILISLSFVTLAKDEKVKESKTVEVTVETDASRVTKKVIVNGKELSPKEIEEFEANGHMKTLHLDHRDKQDKAYKIIVLDDEDVGEHENKENIKISVEADGDKVTKKIMINGKELSPQEIKEFEASGKMKIIHLDTDRHSEEGKHGSKMILIKTGDDEDSGVDIEVIMDKLTGDENRHRVWKNDDGKEINIIKKIIKKNKNGASLGFVANVEDDGWHLNKVIENSGAEKAQIKSGDIVVEIANVDLTQSNNKEFNTLQELPQFKDGESVKVDLLRDGKMLSFDVIASVLDNNQSIVGTDTDEKHFKWIDKTDNNSGELSKQVKVMVFNGDDGDFKLNTDDIHMVFPDDLGDMNVFISDGSSTSKLLGKNHEMSSLSEDLGKYFNTNSGVLVLHVDDSNVFALKDGDVIKSINGTEVKSPKGVVKQLLTAKNQKDIKVKVVRHKRNKTLKYNK